MIETHAEGLPEYAYGVHLETGALIIIKRGEQGYYPYAEPHPKNETTAAILNEKMGLTRAQSAAMIFGSVAGWHCPRRRPGQLRRGGTPPQAACAALGASHRGEPATWPAPHPGGGPLACRIPRPET